MTKPLSLGARIGGWVERSDTHRAAPTRGVLLEDLARLLFDI